MESIFAKKNGSDYLAQTGLKPKDLKGFLNHPPAIIPLVSPLSIGSITGRIKVKPLQI